MIINLCPYSRPSAKASGQPGASGGRGRDTREGEPLNLLPISYYTIINYY